MRKLSNTLVFALAMLVSITAMAQQPEMQYFRPNDQAGLNVFEAPKPADDGEFNGVKVRVGGDFAIQFQGLSQENDHDPMTVDSLVSPLFDLGSNFNLPTANLNLDVQLHKGVRLHMRTYLSSRHHAEAWVKGGYLQIDDLDFIKEDFLADVMDILRFRFGMNDINYGDAHFRRSDNSRAIFNPFAGNYIMDAFTTEPFAEITAFPGDFIIVVGATNGRLNQNVRAGGDGGAVIYGKVGYDKQVNDDLRVRLTGSFYNSSEGGTRDYLYGGDRAGGRYYGVLGSPDDARAADFEPRFNPGFASHTAIQVNPFVKFKGIEFFGIYEMTSNGNSEVGGAFTQIAAELLYRFGANEQFYLGGRYNSVSGESAEGAGTREINRINVGGGWFLTQNVVAKIDYVSSTYSGDGFAGTKYQGAQFNGAVIEAVIGF